MDEKVIREYYGLTEHFAKLLYGMKWLNSKENSLEYEHIIHQTEDLWRKFLAFGINNIGDCEQV